MSTTDGDRPEIRAAARWLAARAQPDDFRDEAEGARRLADELAGRVAEPSGGEGPCVVTIEIAPRPGQPRLYELQFLPGMARVRPEAAGWLEIFGPPWPS